MGELVVCVIGLVCVICFLVLMFIVSFILFDMLSVLVRVCLK